MPVMTPTLRFARTVDGGNVAFTVVGEGYPLVDIFAGPTANVALQWETPGLADFFEALARRFTFVRFDPRGAPNSDPAPEHRTYAEYILDDIDAVAGALGLQRFAMMAYGGYARHLAEYAATRTAAVSHLIFQDPITDSHFPFLEINWEEYHHAQQTQAQWAGVDVATLEAQTMLGPGAAESQVVAYARLLRARHTPQRAAWREKYLERNRDQDVSVFLPRITQPTLVVSRPVTMDAAKGIASAIPGALLVAVDGNPALSLDPAEHEAAAARFARFVYGTDAQRGTPSPGRPASMALATLTPREREVLALLAAGHSNAEICEGLVLSPHTARRHIANIYGKLGIHNRAQAAALHLGALNDGPPKRPST